MLDNSVKYIYYRAMTQLSSTDTGWAAVLGEEKTQPYFQAILRYLETERAAGKTIYPEKHNIFNALKYTDFQEVRVVILGQDPYHGQGQAHGLSFSVQPGVPIPPSLRNMYQELNNDLGIPPAKHGCLVPWAQQGVLLLNTVLTVEQSKPQSHAEIGWQTFTDKIIQALNEHRQNIVFLLWGANAKRKRDLIDPTTHHILQSTHPSPLSAHRGFLGCRHFSKTNEILRNTGQTEIDWRR